MGLLYVISITVHQNMFFCLLTYTCQEIFSDYHICNTKNAIREGNDRVCVYLLLKNGHQFFTSKYVDKQNPRSCPIN